MVDMEDKVEHLISAGQLMAGVAKCSISTIHSRAIELEADAALRGQGKVVHAVAKRVDNDSRVPEHDTFANEKKWLERLSHTGLVAAPRAYDDATRTVVTEYAGHPIDASNVPHDVVAQLGRILDMLEEHNCRHNDFIPRNLLVLDGVVRLIDFTWAWEIDRSVPAAWHEQIPDLGKPTQGLRCAALYDDRCTAENVLDRIAPTALASRRPHTAETHIVADWTNRFANSFIETACRRVGLEVVHAVAMPIMPEATRRATMSRFYSRADLSPSDQRGATPFTLHILRDPNPAYEVRKTTKGHRRVNAKVFDLKQQLRAPTTAGGAPLHLHATDNIQETKDNLETLGLSELYYPKKRFDRVAAALRALDAVPGLRYVVLRHAETVLESTCGNSDVDLLVSDYFKAKTALDGTSTDPPGERYDDGGCGVRNLVSVASRQVSFDLRTVGDGYFDDRWQADVLAERVRDPSGTYVPSDEQYVASLLYHILVQKKLHVSNKITTENAGGWMLRNYGLAFASFEDAWAALDNFMARRGYHCVHEKSETKR
jgi:hypothetical protein